MKVFAYNTHCVPYVTSSQHVDNICAFVRNVVEQENVDVIALSEIFRPWVRRRVLRNLADLPGQWKASPIVNEGNVVVSSGLLVLWRAPVVRDGSMHSVQFGKCCQMDCFSRKGALHIPLAKGAEVLHLVHTHMQAWEIPCVCSGVRDSQFRQIEGLFARIPADQPQLVVGDFNEEPNQAFASALRLNTPAQRLETFEDKFFDHAYFRNVVPGIRLAVVNGDYGPSDHKGVLFETAASP